MAFSWLFWWVKSTAEAPSLLPVALLHHLTRRDPQSLALAPQATAEQRATAPAGIESSMAVGSSTASACGKMVKHFLVQLAL